MPMLDYNGCSATVQCERDQHLVIFKNEGVADYQDRAVHGTCHRQNQTWTVQDGSSTKRDSFDAIFATCVDYKTYVNCFPDTPTTYLFAYSNDIDSSNMKKIAESLKNNFLYPTYISPQLKTLASVRFDLEKEEPIEYYETFDDWVNSLTSKAVAPGSSKHESDILTILNQFLDNKEAPVCGAMINIILKRQPSKTDVSEMVKKLRELHIELFIITVIGSEYPETMMNIATKTHGFGVFGQEDKLDTAVNGIPALLWISLVYSANVEISGENSTQLHPMTINDFGNFMVMVDVPDHYPSSLMAYELEWSNLESELYYNVTGSTANLQIYPAEYTMNFKYNLNSSIPEYARIRFYKLLASVDYWVPYDN